MMDVIALEINENGEIDISSKVRSLLEMLGLHIPDEDHGEFFEKLESRFYTVDPHFDEKDCEIIFNELERFPGLDLSQWVLASTCSWQHDPMFEAIHKNGPAKKTTNGLIAGHFFVIAPMHRYPGDDANKTSAMQFAVAHEMRHVWQQQQGHLSYGGAAGDTIYWRGEPIMTVAEQTELLDSLISKQSVNFSQYKNFPWERDANAHAVSVMSDNGSPAYIDLMKTFGDSKSDLM